MSDGNASDDSGRHKKTRFATPEAPSEVTTKKTRGSPISAARDPGKCINSYLPVFYLLTEPRLIKARAPMMPFVNAGIRKFC